ncbi:Hypothetical protein PHPALM_5902 [Phytophthora palmivora]|uniref:Uncharacterized protein n=1 Tax=Phytophthora palmivora TaxID=4796 RepID=A0A2P4YG76_9STRA|nr:Hypothetical protein PHPALM_5902 [Phytophthora palmivora]
MNGSFTLHTGLFQGSCPKFSCSQTKQSQSAYSDISLKAKQSTYSGVSLEKQLDEMNQKIQNAATSSRKTAQQNEPELLNYDKQNDTAVKQKVEQFVKSRVPD